MDSHYEDLKQFFEQGHNNHEFIELQKQIDAKMSNCDQARFYNLLWCFDTNNRNAFVCNLWNVVCRNLTDSWWVFKYESENTYNASVELMDLIDGWLCECVVDTDDVPWRYDRRITWILRWIKED